MHLKIKPSKLKGEITIPSSKSHTLRAILFASLAKGKSIVHQYLHSPDTFAMISACRLLGANIEIFPNHLIIEGFAGKPSTPNNVIDAGNSGQVLRFIAAVSSLTSGYTVLTGDESIRTSRPIQPLLSALKQLNVFAESTQHNGQAPIIIRGPFSGGVTKIDGEDSQPVSGLLIASAFADNPTTIHVKNPGEKPWIDVTLDWFKRLGISFERENYSKYIIHGNTLLSNFEYTVPGDFSSAAFPLASALITQSNITLKNLDFNDVQGDKAIVSILQKMGAQFEIDTSNRQLHIYPCELQGQEINVNDFIDAVTILAVVACFAKTETIIRGAEIARKKESDRLSAITQELQKMGANIQELPDGLIIQPSRLKGAIVKSHSDHRIAMSLAAASLAAETETLIHQTECIQKTFPDFAKAMQQLGANIESIL